MTFDQPEVKKVGKVIIEPDQTSTSTVKFAWNASTATVPSGATRNYEVGIYDKATKTYLFGTDIAAYFGDELNAVVDDATRSAVIKGLSPKKYTFGVKEIATIDGIRVESMIAKFSATVK